MAVKFESFVARRYLRAKRKEAVVSIVTAISVIGVAAGVSALLGSAYLFTQRAMERQVDLVIDTEIESLREDYRSGGDYCRCRRNAWSRYRALCRRW